MSGDEEGNGFGDKLPARQYRQGLLLAVGVGDVAVVEAAGNAVGEGGELHRDVGGEIHCGGAVGGHRQELAVDGHGRPADGVNQLHHHLTGQGLIAGVDHFGGEGEAVAFVEETRRIGHHHHRLLGHQQFFKGAGAQVLCVAHPQHFPSGE